ncbi:hypothetical protein BCON_0432g00050 [Botryotinia convoluta]|uniref:Uncharacterized protein n=1 Tax=Botryotinia convoluta TaxID=54673 RepID=A0A4Z1H7G9_9HELO|nr:hypothetical protein BCON_0432g00050 [Botryotinia convoluta]
MVWKHRPKPKKQNQETVCKSPETELVAIANTVAPTKKSEFKGFPLDIINILFDILYEEDEKTTIICLALTCRSHWNFFQGKPWKRFQFGTLEDGSFYDRSFIDLIETWIGPGYRRIGINSQHIETLFLSRAVYGDCSGVEEKTLDDRWKDYKTLASRDDGTYRLIHHVPKPFGVSADKWFPLAARQLKNEFLSWGPSNIRNPLLYRCFRRSHLCQWLLSKGGEKWLLLDRMYRKTESSNGGLFAVLMRFPDEGQSWPVVPMRSKLAGTGRNAKKRRKAGR